MIICNVHKYVYSCSFSLVSLSLSPFSLSVSRALFLSFCPSLSLFSPVVPRCIFVDLCYLVSLCVTHARELVLSRSLFFWLSISLSFSLSLSCSLFLFFLYTYMYIPKLGSLHAALFVWLWLTKLFEKASQPPSFALLHTCCCHHSELVFLPDSNDGLVAVLCHDQLVKLLQEGEQRSAGLRDAHRPTPFISTTPIALKSNTKPGILCEHWQSRHYW